MRTLQVFTPDSSFVPKHLPPTLSDVELLRNFLEKTLKLFVLTGAGVSTESGIPDYRSEKVGLYERSNYKPIQYRQFLNSSEARQHYWARNYIGWDRFSQCEPNTTHHWLKRLEIDYCKVHAVVTQNVDGLHFKAGSEKVTELHGTAYRVVCLNCSSTYNRHDVQTSIRKLNPTITDVTTMIRPDGDVEISEETAHSFIPPMCNDCGGVLKPDIVFFGDNVPPDRMAKVQSCVTNSDAIFVLGSSLFVYSGFKIVEQGFNEHKPIAIVNIGQTRADKYATIKIAAKCSDVLERVGLF
ncbi:hypothetical protein FQA39_LY16361 [Lamprigera yunnana]|nr:hypothetical protein FQA39_LY16361 [Lamprigera yunnana]